MLAGYIFNLKKKHPIFDPNSVSFYYNENLKKGTEKENKRTKEGFGRIKQVTYRSYKFGSKSILFSYTKPFPGGIL